MAGMSQQQDLPEAVSQPCNDCPWRKNSIPGWLGPHSAKEWLRMVHGDTAIACHQTIKEALSWEGAKQCAGSGSFRANVCKRPRDPRVVAGPPSEAIFADNQEFLDHHAPGKVWEISDMWANDEEEV